MRAAIWLAFLTAACIQQCYSYEYQSYAAIARQIDTWARLFPTIVKAYSAQQKYGLPSAGQCKSQTQGQTIPCEQWFVEMTNSSSDQVTPDMLPEVFFSGNLHGNEEVGPPTLVALGHLLLENADDNEWIRFLLETRRIVMLPVSNALGYDNHVREENGVDPNRDFPYRTSNCMQTIVARSLNEIFREHLFQVWW